MRTVEQRAVCIVKFKSDRNCIPRRRLQPKSRTRGERKIALVDLDPVLRRKIKLPANTAGKAFVSYIVAGVFRLYPNFIFVIIRHSAFDILCQRLDLIAGIIPTY